MFGWFAILHCVLVDATSLRGIFDVLVIDSGEELPLTRSTQGWLTVELSIGGSAKTLAVDTGSSLLWTRSNFSSGMNNRSSSHLTLADIFAVTRRFSAQYGRGFVQGSVLDQAVVFGRDAGTVQRTCAVGQVTQESSFWTRQISIDGVLGLGCSRSPGGLACAAPGPVEGHNSQRVFALQMDDEGGILSLGFVPPQLRSQLYYMPSSPRCGYWTAPLLSVSASSEVLEQPGEAILDSGSDGIVGPTFAVIKLARLLKASPGAASEGSGAEVTFYTVPCAAAITLPELRLKLGDAPTVTLNGKSLVSLGHGDINATGRCHLRLAGWGTQSWILGRAFLSQLRGAVFDVESQRVAIAV